MEGGKDPDCRRCYPCDKPEFQDRELFAYYQKLIAIRKANPALRTGTFRPFVVDNERELYAYERRANGNHCIVALNRSELEHTVEWPTRIRATDLLTGRSVNGGQFVVPRRGAVILRVEA